jgi:hypothetical protein
MFPSPFFNENVRDVVQAEIIRIVFRGYRDADKELNEADYDVPEYAYLRPYIRLARINYYLRSFNKRFTDCEAIVETNETHNFPYTLLRVGNVIMTVSRVEGQDVLPRNAKYRNIYAGQQSRFDIEQDSLTIVDTIVPADAVLYGIILHSPIKGEHRPGFVDIGFPNENCTDFVGKIRLFKKFPDVVDEMVPEHEHIPDKAEVELKSNVPNPIHQTKLL